MSVTDYESVIGLEVHVELKTPQKLFCGCSTTFGAPPNTQVCPVCLRCPVHCRFSTKNVDPLSARVLRYTVTSRRLRFDRKNYFTPICRSLSGDTNFSPICSGGYVDVATEDGSGDRINRIHLEEDAGKLIHHEDHSLVDCNRCACRSLKL